MSYPEDGGPAFPCTEDNFVINAHDGMALRDYFAIRVMQAFITRSPQNSIVDSSRWAYDYADAMLEARNK